MARDGLGLDTRTASVSRAEEEEEEGIVEVGEFLVAWPREAIMKWRVQVLDVL